MRVVPVLLLCVAVATAAPKPPQDNSDVAKLQTMLEGTWDGDVSSPLFLKKDGSFSWNGYGPGLYPQTGEWKVRIDKQGPILVLTQKIVKEGAKVEAKGEEYRLLRLEEKSFKLRYRGAAGDEKDFETECELPFQKK